MSEVALAYSTDVRFRGLKGRWMDRCELEAAQARVLADEAKLSENTHPGPVGHGEAGGDAIRLRGIPVLAYGGLGGAVKDTRPGCRRSLERVDLALRRLGLL